MLLTAQGCGTAEIIAGSDTGGDRAAAIYTIVQTAKLNGVNPEAYLKDTLTKIAAGHPINKILQLMPWQMLPPAAANLRSRNLRIPFNTESRVGRCSFALHAADQRLTVEHGTVPARPVLGSDHLRSCRTQHSASQPADSAMVRSK